MMTLKMSLFLVGNLNETLTLHFFFLWKIGGNFHLKFYF